jgi:hypothetical protein
MLKVPALAAIHVACIYFLWLLCKDKNSAIKRGTIFTKMGVVSKRKSPRLFRFSIWADFIVLLILYLVFIAYSISLVFQ